MTAGKPGARVALVGSHRRLCTPLGLGAAIRAELAGDRILQIRTGEILRLTSGVGKAVYGHGDKDIRRATCDVLALATMTLCLHYRIAVCFVVYVAAIASTCQFHVSLHLLARLV